MHQMDFFQSASMLCTTGWTPVHQKMVAETAALSVAEIKSLKLNVFRSYLPIFIFNLGDKLLKSYFMNKKEGF